MKTRTITTFAAIAAASLAGVSAYAGTQTVRSQPSKPVKEAMQESCITGDIGLDIVSNYIARGLVLENQGIIIQPYANLHFRVAQNVGPVESISVDLGIWNSLHSHHDGPRDSTTRSWFESDFIAGMTFNIDKFAVSPYFKIYQSPADVFESAYVAGLRLAYDDTDLLGDFALHPYAKVELNVIETSGNNYDPFTGLNRGNGQYYEVGVTPAHSWGDLTLSLPLKGGFGSGGFYLGNRGFGFFSVGLDAAYALNFVPECLGKWAVHTGATYVRIGGNNDPLAPSGAAGFAPAFGGVVSNENQVVFGGGLKVAF